MKKVNFQGTITALVTPFKSKSIDFDAFQKLIEMQIQNKVDGIVVCGSTGESATLTLKEKMALIIKAVEYSAGRVPIIAGTGSNETQATLDLSIYAQENGANGVLIVAPYYNKPTQTGLYEHFWQIDKHLQIPIIIYNVPGRTGVNILPETQLKLAQNCKNIIATKEASGDMDQIMEIIKNAPKGFNVLSGDDSLTLPLIAAGAKGIVSVISNYAPKQFGDMVRLAMAGKYEESRKIHYQLFDLMNLNFVEPNPIPVKCAMFLLGYVKNILRMPLLPITEKNEKIIKEALIKAGLLSKTK